MKLLPYKSEVELKNIVEGALLGMTKKELNLLAEQVHEDTLEGRINETLAANAMREIIKALIVKEL